MMPGTSDSGEHTPAGKAIWRRVLLFLSALEMIAGLTLALFFISQAGGDPLGDSIAYGMAGFFGLFFVLGALPAFLLAWHGRFLIASGGLALGAPLMMILAWRVL